MKSFYLKGLLTIGLATSLWSCSDDITNTVSDVNNNYAQTFIKEFGIPDPNHDWSMATQADLVLKSSKPVSVQVLAEIDGMRYIFADLQNFKGSAPVPVTIPKVLDELIIVANGIERTCAANATVDIDQMLGAASRSVFSYNDNQATVAETSTGSIEIDIANPYNRALREFIMAEIDTDENLPFSQCYNKDGVDVTEQRTASFYPHNCWYFSGTYDDGDNPNYRMADFDIIPLYVRRQNPSAAIDFNFGICHGDAFQATLIKDNGDYNIQYKATEDADPQFTTQPDLSSGLWQLPVTNFKVSDSGKDYHNGGITLFVEKNGIKSHTYNDYNKPEWNNEDNSNEKYFDVTLGKKASYYTAAFVEQIDITTTTGKKMSGFICGIYFAPTQAHQTRAPQPDAYVFLAPHGNRNSTSLWGNYSCWRWRILGEDLGGTDDFDFNDIVIDYNEILKSYLPYQDGDWDNLKVARSVPEEVTSTFPTVKEVTVTPRAAGGIMPIYVTWHGPVYKPNDYLIGRKVSDLLVSGELVADPEECILLIGDEIHHWLGSSSTENLINTQEGITASGRQCKFTTKHDYNVSENFSIIIDKNGAFNQSTNGASYIKIDEISNIDDAFTKVDCPNKGSATPQMIIVAQNVPWPTEKTPIHDAYNGFSEWVADQEAGKYWYTTWVTGKIIEEPGVNKPVIPENK